MPTRPRPLVHRFSQSCSDWISRDVSTNLLELFSAPAKPVERLVLPERLSDSAELEIRESCRTALDALRDPGHICFGRDQQMHMIWHNDKFMQNILEQRSFGASLDSPANFLGDRRVGQPARSVRRLIEEFVHLAETDAVGEVGLIRAVENKSWRKAAAESPGEENGRAGWENVGKMAAIRFTQHGYVNSKRQTGAQFVEIRRDA